MFTKTLGIVAALCVAFGATAVRADSPHFIRGPTAALDGTTGDDCVSFKEAGLGNTPITFTLTAQVSTFTFQCFTNHDNTPQGAPNNVSFSNEEVTTTITPHNGQITASICLDPQRGDAGCQGGGLTLKLIHVLYQNVRFCDVTDNICVDLGTIDADVGPISFGRGNGH